MATALEYGLIAAGIAVASIAVLKGCENYNKRNTPVVQSEQVQKHIAEHQKRAEACNEVAQWHSSNPRKILWIGDLHQGYFVYCDRPTYLRMTADENGRY